MKNRTELFKIAGSGLSLLAAVFFVGCAGLEAGAAASSIQTPEADEAVALGDAFINAFRTDDYPAVRAILADNLDKEFSEEIFKQANFHLKNTLGEIARVEYLAELETPVLRTLVWKVEFKRQGSDGAEIAQETLFKALFAELDGKLRIISFNFI